MAADNPIPTHPRFKNLLGLRTKYLTVIAYAGSRKRGRNTDQLWQCWCSACEHLCIKAAGNLQEKGPIDSCGCMAGLAGYWKMRGSVPFDPVLYRTWQHMLQRCYDSRKYAYYRYGGRGIKVCDRWKNSYQAFRDDMGPRTSSEHSIDRIDNDGDYCPENCRWATRTEQGRNRCNNRRLTWNGKTQTVAEWAREVGMTRKRLVSRLDVGWDIEKALTTPVAKRYREIQWRGESHSVREWAGILGINIRALEGRLAKGWTIERAFTQPLGKSPSLA